MHHDLIIPTLHPHNISIKPSPRIRYTILPPSLNPRPPPLLQIPHPHIPQHLPRPLMSHPRGIPLPEQRHQLLPPPNPHPHHSTHASRLRPRLPIPSEVLRLPLIPCNIIHINLPSDLSLAIKSPHPIYLPSQIRNRRPSPSRPRRIRTPRPLPPLNIELPEIGQAA
ncbi:hypothetical protein GRF29_164g835168 [Pseudopithomyces chartarum]|uniref:Uncharacterized protein n=1 Tax=Pseudopithomyces chartarum TaxID=1892770 RepID=A0AAN6RDQ5_9PLEO|nr:hypothetical protein GRF29_164g835168 [Pseudopithomyces chartarum]